MDKSEVLSYLSESLKHHEWFAETGLDPQTHRVTVYVNKMNSEVYATIPDSLHGYQIMMAFEAYKNGTRDQFVNDLTKPNFTQYAPVPMVMPLDVVEELESVYENHSTFLAHDLDALQKICGSNILQDIFYEVHDGTNAVTNLSARYPEVRESLEKLYDEYGFDVIYEELDG